MKRQMVGGNEWTVVSNKRQIQILYYRTDWVLPNMSVVWWLMDRNCEIAGSNPGLGRTLGYWASNQNLSHSWTNYKVQPSHIYSCYNLCVEMFPQENRSNRWQHCKWKSMSVQKFKKLGCGGGQEVEISIMKHDCKTFKYLSWYPSFKVPSK